MTAEHSSNPDDQQLGWADALCHRFEDAWGTDRHFTIEFVLSEISASKRNAALKALLQVECKVRARAGDTPSADELRRRFPDDRDTVTAVLANATSDDMVTQDRTIAPRSAGDGIDDSSSGALRIPQQLGRYRIIRKLGQGAMGSVFLAHDEQLDRQVALKIPRGDLQRNRDMRLRFEREAQAAAALRHPNICQIHDVGDFAGIHYICMGYVEGFSLTRYAIAESGLTEQRIAELVMKLARAVAVAHEAGFIHRDLKPANVMVDHNDEPVILDFGLARRVDRDEDTRVTQTGTTVGSPAYISPEQVDGDQDRVGPQTDVYSLGVMLYELLTGRLPFEGSMASVLGQIMTKEPDKPSDYRRDLTVRLEKLCLRMMAKDISQRHPSMHAVAAGLKEYLDKYGDQALGAPPDDDNSIADKGLLRRQQIEGLIRSGDYSKAEKLLVKLSREVDESMIVAATWAADELPKLRKTREEVRTGRQEMYNTAVRLMKSHDYRQAAQLLEEYPYDLRTPKMQELLEEAEAMAAHVRQLRKDLKDAQSRSDHRAVLSLAKQLLEVKPGDRRSREILELLASRRSGPISRLLGRRTPRVLAKTGAVTQWGLLGGLAFMCLLSAAYLFSERLLAEEWRTAIGAMTDWNWLWRGDADLPGEIEEDLVPIPAVIPGLVSAPRALANVDNWQLATREPRSRVISMALSPNGKELAVAAGHYVRILDADSLVVKRFLVGQRGETRAVAWSPDGTHLAACGKDGTVRTWSAAGIPELVIEEDGANFMDIDWMPDGKSIIVTSRAGMVYRWNDDGTFCQSWSLFDDFGRCAQIGIHPDGTSIIVATAQGVVRITDGEPPQRMGTYHRGVSGVAWHPDGTQIAVAGDTMFTMSANGEMLHEGERCGWGGPREISWNPNGSQFAVSAYSNTTVFSGDLSTSREVPSGYEFGSSTRWGDRESLYIGTTWGAVVKFDATDWTKTKALLPAGMGVESVAIKGDSTKFGAGRTRGAMMWTADGQQVERLKHGRWHLQWLGDSDQVLSVEWRNKISRVSDTASDSGDDGPQLFEIDEEAPEVALLRCSHDGQHCAARIGGKELQFWNADGQQTRKLELHTVDLDWHPKRGELCVATREGAMLITPDGELRPLPGSSNDEKVAMVRWRPDGQAVLLVDWFRQDFRVVSADGVELYRNTLPEGSFVRQAEWSSDGKRIAFSDQYHHRIAIVGEMGEVTHWLEGHAAPNPAIGWSPDGRWLISGGMDSLIIVRNADDLSIVWTGLNNSLPASWSADGTLLSGEPEMVESGIVYLVEAQDGAVRMMDGREFRILTGQPPLLSDSSLVRNGDFEFPKVTGRFASFPRHGRIPYWNIAAGNVDVGNRIWMAATGEQCVDCCGTVPGIIEQVVNTQPGQTYEFSFQTAGYISKAQSLQVSWGNLVLDTITMAIDSDLTQSAEAQPLRWEPRRYKVTAAAASTRLRFESLTGTNQGVLIDDVKLVAIEADTGNPQVDTEGAKFSDGRAGFVRKLNGHTEPLTFLEISPDSRHCVSAAWERTVRVWDVVDGLEKDQINAGGPIIYCGAFLDDGQRIVLAGTSGKLALYDISTCRELKTYVGHAGSIDHVFISPGNDRIVSFGRDQTSRLWDLASGQEIGKMIWDTKGEGEGYKPTHVARVGRDSMLAREGVWGNPNYWRMGFDLKRQLVGKALDDALRGHGTLGESAVCDTRGSLLAISSGDKLSMYSANTGALRRSVSTTGKQAYTMAFSDDDTQVVTVCRDETVRLRSVTTGRQTHSFPLDSDATRFLDVSDDSRFFVTADRGRYSDSDKKNIGLGDYGIEVWRMPQDGDQLTTDLPTITAARSASTPAAASPEYKKVLRPGRDAATTWRYTTSQPATGWKEVEFNDSGWKSGRGGFGSRTSKIFRTHWDSDFLWVRTTFQLSALPTAARWIIFHDDDTIIYINGTAATRFKGYTTGHRSRNFDAVARNALCQGTNTIAAYCRNYKRHDGNPGFLDIGIEVR